jgi:TolA-binding protein
VNVVQPTHIVGSAQIIQQLRVTEAEVDELKQSLRYVEIQLAKAQEEKETLGTRIKTMDQEHERQADNLAK